MLKYRLEQLGWYQFERLIQSLLKAELGMGIESWGGHKDFGIDAYFEGELNYPGNFRNKGIFIFQVKFSEKIDSSQGLRILKNAVRKWADEEKKRLSKPKFRNRDNVFYTIITNVPLTSQGRKDLLTDIQNILNLPREKIFIQDGHDVCALLDKHKSIRWSYPQLLGLQDIESLLNEVLNKDLNKDLMEKSEAIIERARELAYVFVPTKAYKKAIKVLNKHHFAVFEGPPEVGKTTTAYMIALNKVLDEWEAYDCRAPHDFFRIYNKDKRQIFLADDAFGSTEYRPDLADDWARELDKIFRKLDKFHWFIWTTRTHILRAALRKMHLQGEAENFPKPAEVVIDVSDFDFEEKALILYRHAKRSNLESYAKEIVKRHWKEIIENKYFTPLRAKRFITVTLPNILSRNDKANNTAIIDIIQKEIKTPTLEIRKAFENLSIEHKRLLFSMLDSTPSSTSEISIEKLRESFQRHCLQPSLSFEKIVEQIDLAFIRKEKNRVRWLHPSVRDLVIELLKESPSERINFIKSSGIEGIFLILTRKEQGTLELFPDGKSWEALIERMDGLVKVLDSSTLSKLMDILLDLKDVPQVSNTKYFKESVLIVLNGVKDLVENENLIPKLWIISPLVEKFYKLLSKVFPNRPSPNWTILWENLKKEAYNELKSDHVIWDKLEPIETLVELSSIYKKYDPIVLSALKFPDSLSKLFLRYLSEIDEEIKYELWDEDYDILINEAEGWRKVEEFLQKSLGLFRDVEFKDRIKTLINESQDKAFYYEERAEEIRPYDETDYNEDYWEEDYWQPSAKNKLSDIEKLFDDL